MNPRCTNCGKPSESEYCATCEPLRERLESLREKQRQYWRDVRSGKRVVQPPKKTVRGGAHFLMQCRKHAPSHLNNPVSGQDAALPPSDR